MIHRLGSTLLTFVLLCGCSAQQAPATRLYLLATDATNRSPALTVPARIAINQVRVASYLQQPGIVMTLDDGSIRAASFHQWGEPLRDGLRRSLANEIAAALEEPVRFSEGGALAVEAPASYIIDLLIPRLHATGEGVVILEAFWSIRSQGLSGAGTGAANKGAVTEHELRLSSPLKADGYAAVVAAHEAALAMLAGAIAEALSVRLGSGLQG